MSTKCSKGHRGRMRNRLVVSGGSGMCDYELLEVLLFSSIPRRDVRKLAKGLLGHCADDLASLVNSSVDHLRQLEGMGEASIAMIVCVRAIIERVLFSRVKSGPILNNWTALIDYLRTVYKGVAREQLRVMYMDKRYKVIDETVSEGTVDKVSIYDREILRHALYKGATSLVISHNHLSDDPSPSHNDVVATKKLVTSCGVVGLQVIDHVVVASQGYFSFKEHGLI